MRGETHTTTETGTTWGDDTTKEVGIIKINGAHTVDFDSTNYPGEPGDLVAVVNVTGTAQNVTIAPAPFGDATADTVSCGAGDTVTVLYSEDNGWFFFSVAAAS